MRFLAWLSQTPGERRQYRRGERVYSAGDRPTHLFAIESGLVGLTLVSPSGTEHLLRLFAAGTFFGHRSVLAQEAYHADAMALEESVVKCVRIEELSHVLGRDGEVSRDLLQQLARDLGRAERQRIDWLEADVHSRVAEAVVYLKERYGNHRWTRAEIASFCGSTVSTVIKTLAKFEEQGWIAQSGREIQVLDRAALLALGEDHREGQL
ncbi:MAG TPA: Crp/Fnr family transcriptional regulator [Pseudobdellovibrionaceae bacterium]|nr:Crp/Fnr family transcriptional regulator [Pseudobdellovibrionaceae bacterium]